MVRLNRGVNKCVRKKDETVKEYIRRFKILALGYLNMVRDSEDSPES